MAVLLEDLPDEVLLEVISHIHRSFDLFSLKQVSHRLHRLVLASPSLAYSRTYSSVKCGHDGRTINEEDGPLLFRTVLYTTLVAILKFPERALYVQRINLEWDYEASNEYFELADEDAKYLLELVFKHTGILEWKGGEAFAGALRERKQEAYVALVLLLLGNLDRLNITLARYDFWVHWAIEKAVSSSFLPPSLSAGLRSLRMVEIDWNAEYRPHNDGISLYNIVPFLLLPAIDQIEAHKVEHDESYVEHDDYFDWEEKCGTSSVTFLWFNCSSINLEALEEILRIPKRLKYFSYWYYTRHSNEAGQDDVKAIEDFKERMQDSLVDCEIDFEEYT